MSSATAGGGVKRKAVAMATGADTPQAITVVVKIRPPNARELELAKASPQSSDLDFFTLSDDSQAITFDNTAPPNKPSWSRFDHVFDVDKDQADTFQGTAVPIVSACLQGYNGCLMAYGQTGSGKTYTMNGPKDALTDSTKEHLRGILPRAMDQLFSTIAATPGMSFEFRASF